MGQCFVPECNHYSESHDCKFHRFPKDPAQRRRWITLIRRADREPGNGARVCSCHFRGNRSQGPEIFPWNKEKLFDAPVYKPKKKRLLKKEPGTEVCEIDVLQTEFKSEPEVLRPITNPLQTGILVFPVGFFIASK